MTEHAIQSTILIELQRQWPNGVFYRRNIGAMRDAKGNFIRFGMPGQADIGAIVEGFAVEIEVKSNMGRQSKEQRRWQAAVERAGGLYVLARSPADAINRIMERIA